MTLNMVFCLSQCHKALNLQELIYFVHLEAADSADDSLGSSDNFNIDTLFSHCHSIQKY